MEQLSLKLEQKRTRLVARRYQSGFQRNCSLLEFTSFAQGSSSILSVISSQKVPNATKRVD